MPQFANILRLTALLAALTFAGCAGAPVQDMSNARQAVMAAQQMGAAQSAPREFAQAQQWLTEAQAALDRGDYGEARADALRARDKAVEAIRIHQGLANPGPP